MSDAKPSLSRRLVKLGGAVIWMGLVAALGRPAGGGAKVPRRASPKEDAAELRHDVLTYSVGYGLSFSLTLLAFALVYWRWAEPPLALGIVFGLGLAQALVHFRCFLHVDFRAQSRDDLLLILFSTMIVCLMVGGTLVVLFNLRARMM